MSLYEYHHMPWCAVLELCRLANHLYLRVPAARTALPIWPSLEGLPVPPHCNCTAHRKLSSNLTKQFCRRLFVLRHKEADMKRQEPFYRDTCMIRTSPTSLSTLCIKLKSHSLKAWHEVCSYLDRLFTRLILSARLAVDGHTHCKGLT